MIKRVSDSIAWRLWNALVGSVHPDCALCLVMHKLICVRSERILDGVIASLGQGRGEGLSGLGL